jgi:serine/threonine-protein kinase
LLVLVVIAAWLQLQSATSWDNVVIPGTAVLPEIGTVREVPAEELPTTKKPIDMELDVTPEWNVNPRSSRSNDTDSSNDPTKKSLVENKEDSNGFTPFLIPNEADEQNLRSESGRSDRGDADSNEASGQVTPQTIRIVAELNADAGASDVLNATTLRDALVMARENKVNLIEITVPEVVSEPVDFQVEDLWIRSTVSGGTIIRFEAGNTSARVQGSMLDVGSSDVVMEDINFVWQVPSDRVSGGSLFEVHENTLLRLTDCSITVSNPNPDLLERLYAFDVIAAASRFGDATVGEPEVHIELNNVVVRGEMTMLHMGEAVRLELDWDNGLLAVSGNMIDTGGTRAEDVEERSRIELEFWRVTVHASAGIFRMSAAVDTPYPAVVDRQARQSVFIVDQNRPHFQFSGFPKRFQGSELLLLRGSSNLYQVGPDFRDVMLRVVADDGVATVTQMMDLEESPPEWVTEKSPRRSSSVVRIPREWPPAGERIPAVYQQTDASPRGFTPDSLPTLPVPKNNENEGLSIGRTL